MGAYNEWRKKPLPKLITGNELMALGFEEGPIIGKILNEIREKQISGEMTLKEEALRGVPAETRVDRLGKPVPPDVRLVVALDARVIVDRARLREPGKPYAHLALRPYPEELERHVTLRDGTRLLLRPIRPEDEPHWIRMLDACSRETIYMRFRYMFQWATHEVATRYCFTDYDREIAMVAEREDAGEPRLVGVGRLVRDPGHDTAEYAVLISDAWQNRGLGGVLTDVCEEIARGWGLSHMVAQTTADNARMLALFRKRGYAVEPDDEGLMKVEKALR